MKSFRSNALHNIAGWLFPLVIFVFLTPYLIRRLGVEAFGLYTLSQAISGYMNILNFGFSDAITRDIANSYGNDNSAVRESYWSGLLLFGTVAVIGCAILVVLAEPLSTTLLEISPNLRDPAAIIIKVTGFTFALQMLAELYRGIAVGAQRFDIPNVSRNARLILSAILMIVAVEFGYGIVGVALAGLIGLAIGLVQNVVWMHNACQLQIFTEFTTFERVWAKFISNWNFAKHIFGSRIASLTSGRLLSLLLGGMTAVSSVGALEVVNRIFDTPAALISRVTGVLYPALSVLARNHEFQQVRTSVARACRMTLIVIVPVTVFLVATGDIIIHYWLGSEMAKITSIIIFPIGLSIIFNSTTNIYSIALMSVGQTDFILKFSLAQGLGTVALAIPLVYFFGLAGAAITLLVVGFVSLLFTQLASVRLFGIGIFKEYGRSIVIQAILSTGILIVASWFVPSSSLVTIPVAMSLLALQLWLSVRLGCLTPEDLEHVRAFVSISRKR